MLKNPKVYKDLSAKLLIVTCLVCNLNFLTKDAVKINCSLQLTFREYNHFVFYTEKFF